MRRAIRIGLYVTIGVLVGLLSGVAVVIVLTHTGFGIQRVERYAVGKLRDQIHGELEVGGITGPDLLGGVTIHHFSIHGPDQRPFVEADSARISYDWTTLLKGEIVLDHVRLFQPRIELEQLPGDTLWNYQHIFAAEGGSAPAGPARLVLLHDIEIMNGTAMLRTPWQPGPGSSADAVPWTIESSPGGQVRTLRFDSIHAALGRVLWSSPAEEGQLVEVRALSTRAFLFRQPLRVADAKGTLAMTDTAVTFDFPAIRLAAGSEAAAVGRVARTPGRNRLDVRVDNRKLDFRDFQWLQRNLPAEGSGKAVLRIVSQDPKGTLFLLQDAQLSAPGTKMAGTFGIVVGDTLYFTRVHMTASPLDLELLKGILPPGLPVDGLLVGTVEVSGPVSALDTNGDVRFTPPAGDPSAVRWRGTLDLRHGFAASALHADLDRLQLETLAGLWPGAPLHGTLRGTLEAGGSWRDTLRVHANLFHTMPGSSTSGFAGDASLIHRDSVTLLDGSFDARPLSLNVLSALYPSLGDLDGVARGPIRLHGPLRDLTAEITLAAGGGSIDARGRIASAGGTSRVDVAGSLNGVHLDRVHRAAPAARVTGHFGFDLATALQGRTTGRLSFDLDSAHAAGIGFDAGVLRARWGDGMAHIDTLTARTAGGRLHAEGDFGLDAGERGTVRVVASSTSLTPFQMAVFGDSLFDPLAPPRLAGTAAIEADLTGSVHDFDVKADVSLEDWVYDRDTGRHIAVHLDGRGWRGPQAIADLEAHGDSLRVAGQVMDSAAVRVAFRKPEALVSAGAWTGGDTLLSAGGTWRDGGDGARALALTSLQLGQGDSAWVLRRPARVALAGGTASLDSLALGTRDGAGSVSAAGTLAWLSGGDVAASADRPVDFHVDMRRAPLTDLLHLMKGGTRASGNVDARLRITGTAASPLVNGDLTVNDLRFGELAMQRLGTQFTYATRTVNARVEGEYDGRRVLLGDGAIPLDLTLGTVTRRRLDENLQYTLRVDSLPAGFLAGWVGGLGDLEGRIDGTVLARGTTVDPTLGGSLRVTGGAVTWDATNVRYRDVTATLTAAGDRVVNVDLAMRAVEPGSRTRVAPIRSTAPGAGPPPGATHIVGTVDFQHPTDPALALDLAADHLLSARRRDVELVASGSLKIEGRYRRPEISGQLVVNGGALYLDELYRQYQIVQLENPLLFNLVDTTLVSVRRVLPATQNPFLRNLVVHDATVSVGPGSWLRSRDMNVEVTGDLAVALDRQRDDLRLTGTLTASRGTYTLYYLAFARRFDVRDGTVDFPGTPGIDPNMAITAAYRVRTTQGDPLDITATVSGTLQNPRVRLSSDAQPPISESDLASYLFFGAPTYALGNNLNPRSTGAGADARGFAGLGFQALAPSAFGYVASGLQTLGQNFGLVDYVGLTTAEIAPGSQPQPAGLGSLFAGTEVQLGRYVRPSVFLAVTKRLDTPARDAGLRLEWQFHPTFRAEFFAEDRFARTPSFGFGEASEFRKVYGFFLFRQWGY